MSQLRLVRVGDRFFNLDAITSVITSNVDPAGVEWECEVTLMGGDCLHFYGTEAALVIALLELQVVSTLRVLDDGNGGISSHILFDQPLKIEGLPSPQPNEIPA